MLLALALFYLWGQHQHQRLLSRLGKPELIAKLTRTVDHQGRRLKYLYWWLAVALLLVAAARPQWGIEVRKLERESAQIMVVLDVSQSMLAGDLKPDRLSRAKLVIDELMARLEGDEIGLVLFAGAAFVQFPLTTDYATARSFLAETRPGLIARPGTNLGAAVKVALEGFDMSSNGQRVVVLMTDGERHDEEALDAVRAAAADEVIFYTIGFGSAAGVRIPERNARGAKSLLTKPIGRAMKLFLVWTKRRYGLWPISARAPIFVRRAVVRRLNYCSLNLPGSNGEAQAKF